MPLDRREQILLKIQALLGTVDGLGTNVFRDTGGLNNETLPAAVLLDGTEELVTVIKGHSFGQSMIGMPPAIFMLKPEIFIICKPRSDESNLFLAGPNGSSISAPIGPELSAFRVKVIKALTTDINLIAMLGSNGQIEYIGSETDMRTANTLQGMMLLHFNFSYVLNPAEL